MLDVAKVNPVLKAEAPVKNYSFKTFDKDLYLVANTVTGDGAYEDDTVIPAGEYLNGFLVKAWEGQNLVVDKKHIAGDFGSIEKGNVLVAQEDGTLKVGEAAGVHFVVTETKIRLTESAIKVKVVVAPAAAA